MRILLIDCDTIYADRMKSEIDKHYLVDVAYNGEEGVYMSQVNDYAAIVVDTPIVDLHAADLCEKAKKQNNQIPIVMLLEGNDLDLKISSLDCGADVILSKPVEVKELLAYLRAFMKRRCSGDVCKNIIKANDLTLDLEAKEVWFRQKYMPLRRKEYEILECLMLNRGKIVTKERLLESIWEDGVGIYSNTLEVHIKGLREKIGYPLAKRLIKTVYGFGYKLDIPQ